MLSTLEERLTIPRAMGATMLPASRSAHLRRCPLTAEISWWLRSPVDGSPVYVEEVSSDGSRYYSSGGHHYGDVGTTSRSVAFGLALS